MEYLRDNRTLHKGRHAVKSEVAHKYVQFFELTALAQVGAISRDVDEKWYYLNTSSIAPHTTPDEMFTGERFGGTTPITIKQERIVRTKYMNARHNADKLRAEARAKAFVVAPDGFRKFQNSANCFYEAVELEARYARELFDLLTDQTYD